MLDIFLPIHIIAQKNRTISSVLIFAHVLKMCFHVGSFSCIQISEINEKKESKKKDL